MPIAHRIFWLRVYWSMTGYLLSGLAPRNRKKMNAMIITQMKIRIETADPRPRLSRLTSCS